MDYSEYIDPLILPAVELLNKHGFETFESCKGGKVIVILNQLLDFLGMNAAAIYSTDQGLKSFARGYIDVRDLPPIKLLFLFRHLNKQIYLKKKVIQNHFNI